MRKHFLRFASLLAILFLAGCETNQTIVNNFRRTGRQRNRRFSCIQGRRRSKSRRANHRSRRRAATTSQYSITVASDRSVDAMSILNKVGLPTKKGTTLLELFAKSGLMSSTLEETVRYQAGLAEELKNTIRKIDGVIDADVQISFPNVTGGGAGRRLRELRSRKSRRPSM